MTAVGVTAADERKAAAAIAVLKLPQDFLFPRINGKEILPFDADKDDPIEHRRRRAGRRIEVHFADFFAVVQIDGVQIPVAARHETEILHDGRKTADLIGVLPFPDEFARDGVETIEKGVLRAEQDAVAVEIALESISLPVS